MQWTAARSHSYQKPDTIETGKDSDEQRPVYADRYGRENRERIAGKKKKPNSCGVTQRGKARGEEEQIETNNWKDVEAQ